MGNDGLNGFVEREPNGNWLAEEALGAGIDKMNRQSRALTWPESIGFCLTSEPPCESRTL